MATTNVTRPIHLYFTDVFRVDKSKLKRYGAFNISLITDLPLFIDPFLLFNSRRHIYRKLHHNIIKYLVFLRNKSAAAALSPALLSSWYYFSEVEQNWLGFSAQGNQGRGLGREFALVLNDTLHSIFSSFGKERVTKGSHLEKLCLIKDGVGRDTISDFTTNLIKGFLLDYTQQFAKKFIDRKLRKRVSVERAKFNYRTESWERRVYDLPWYRNDYVLLTPRNLLTKEDIWISRRNLFDEFSDIPTAIPNAQLRAEVDNYLKSALGKEPTKKEEGRAYLMTLRKFPVLIDYYIRHKENNGDQAVRKSAAYVIESAQLYVDQFGKLVELVRNKSNFYGILGNTADETRQRIEYFKDIVENKGGYRYFYVKRKPIRSEEDLHILFRLVWFGTLSDVSTEVNDGRGPADFKISKGAFDKTIVEMKLARNTHLEKNLQEQAELYQKASGAGEAFKVIIFFSEDEEKKVKKILSKLKLLYDPKLILIDGRADNKPSASRA